MASPVSHNQRVKVHPWGIHPLHSRIALDSVLSLPHGDVEQLSICLARFHLGRKSGECYKVVPQFGITKLVNITPITMVYGRYIYNSTYNWGGTTLYPVN